MYERYGSHPHNLDRYVVLNIFTTYDHKTTLISDKIFAHVPAKTTIKRRLIPQNYPESRLHAAERGFDINYENSLCKYGQPLIHLILSATWQSSLSHSTFPFRSMIHLNLPPVSLVQSLISRPWMGPYLECDSNKMILCVSKVLGAIKEDFTFIIQKIPPALHSHSLMKN